MTTFKASPPKKHRGTVTLKAVAQHLGLTPGTVSAVLNNSAAARSIPEHTRKRIIAAARELKYRPNFLARSLRVQRTFSIGVITEETGASSLVSKRWNRLKASAVEPANPARILS